MGQSKMFWDKIWRDGKGRVVLWQSPNLLLIAWAGFDVLSRFFHNGRPKNGIEFLSTSFLLIWAYLEITSGVNYFRRTVGLLVFAMIIFTHF